MEAKNRSHLRSVPCHPHGLKTLPFAADLIYDASANSASSTKSIVITETTDSGAVNVLAKGADNVPQPYQTIQSHEPKVLTVKALATRYGLNPKAVYEFIKLDPTFPYRNVGVKKKYVVPVDEFETWLKSRTEKEKRTSFYIPSNDELLAAFNKPKKGGPK